MNLMQYDSTADHEGAVEGRRCFRTRMYQLRDWQDACQSNNLIYLPHEVVERQYGSCNKKRRVQRIRYEIHVGIHI